LSVEISATKLIQTFFGKFFFGGHDRITSMLAEELSAKAVEEEFNRIGF
jgi:hypothetical protein